MSALDIAAIRKRLDAATPGEWQRIGWDVTGNCTYLFSVLSDPEKRGREDVQQATRNLNFIAGAPEDIRVLLAEVARLTALPGGEMIEHRMARPGAMVGCERLDGTLHIHPKAETCAVCGPRLVLENEQLRAEVERLTQQLETARTALQACVTAFGVLKEGTCWCAFTRDYRQRHSAACDDAGEALAGARAVLGSEAPEVAPE